MPLAALPTTTIRGLSEVEADRRLKADGPNELPQQDRRTPLRIVLEVLREPMLALLLGGGVIYLLLGDLKEALILLVFASLSVLITVIQETRTERVLEALRDLTSPRALVIRDGERRRIAGREIARGDMVILSEGDRVPADALVVQCHDLQCDESLLTGEATPVRKIATTNTAASMSQRPGGDDLPFVFSGSLVVRGTAIAQVVAIGAATEIGKIGQSLKALDTEPPRLQAQMRRLVRIFALIGALVSVSAVLLYGALRGGWLEAILAGISLGMAMLPEEFPLVLTVFMAMGAWRISQARVLTRRAAAIETLGSATVLCTDKTGTLTENRMAVAELRLKDGTRIQHNSSEVLPKRFHELIEFGLLASAPLPVDPMEKAFQVLGQAQLDPSRQQCLSGWKLVQSYGLRPELLAMTQVWQPNDGTTHVVAAKGAPEAIAALCRLDEADRIILTESVNAMAADGLRVLGIARAAATGDIWPQAQWDFEFEYLGLIGLADPLRASVPEAVSQCRSAGIRVIMITGDYPATAKTIAKQAGLDVDDIATSEDFEKLKDRDLAQRVRTATVFARIMPEQKLLIVEALKANGEIVAMTGDGVNDAPSLKAAHIGIAMGGRGTDVAREASSIVLLDDDFGSIVTAIRLGRRIYDNLRKAMGFIFAVHIPIAGMALIPLIFGLPVILGPIHIAFLEMVIDPVCSLVFEAEAEEDDVMGRSPRDPNEELFSTTMIFWGLLQGMIALGMVATIFLVALSRGMPEDEVRALTFFSLVTVIVALIFSNRSFSASLMIAISKPNRALLVVMIAVPAMLAFTLIWPTARVLFRFGSLHFDDLATIIAAAIATLLALELVKFLLARTSRVPKTLSGAGPKA